MLWRLADICPGCSVLQSILGNNFHLNYLISYQTKKQTSNSTNGWAEY